MASRYFRPQLPAGHIFTFGKTGCQPKNSKVLMADGSWKSIQNLKEGDEIISPKNEKEYSIEKVKGISSFYSKENYDVFDYKGKRKLYTCSSEHKIPLCVLKNIRQTINGERIHKEFKWEIKNFTAERFYKMNGKTRQHNHISFSCPKIKYFKNKKNLDLDAYSLGVYLGDGTYTKNKTLGITTKDKEIIKRIPYQIMSHKRITYFYPSKDFFAKKLKSLNLYGKKSGEKFIPKEALLSDFKYRKNLLEGLIDSDGYFSRGNYVFLLKSKRLIEDIKNLVYSLGGKTGQIIKKTKKIKSSGFKGVYYQINIYLGKLKLKVLKRKSSRYHHFQKLSSNRRTIMLKKSKPCRVYGLEISGKSKLYITDNWMVTHNSGKSWKTIAIVQFYHSHNYKIWDLWGGERKEGGFWAFPSDEKKLWFDYKKEVGSFSNEGPKQYKVDLYFPFFKDTIKKDLPEKQLPEKKPHITSYLFTLYFKDIEPEVIATITGALSQQAKWVWEKIQKELPDNANSEDILNWFEKDKKHKGFKKLTLYRRFIEPFCENQILQGKNFRLNLDIIKIAKEKENVFVLMNEYTPHKYVMFFIIYIMKKIRELAEKDIIHRQNLAFFRELNYFMKVEDASTENGEQKQIMRGLFSDIVRYGRSGIIIAGDTQSPAEVKGLVEGQQDLLCLCELPGTKDREVACDTLIRDGRMSTEHKNYLGCTLINSEQMIVVARGEKARLIKKVQPPRTKCFKVSDGSFLRHWKTKLNSYRDISQDIQDIDDACLFRRKEIEKLNEYQEEEFDEEEEYVETEEENEIPEPDEETEDLIQKEKIKNDENKRYIELKRKEAEDFEITF